jgi:hypothetical protein
MLQNFLDLQIFKCSSCHVPVLKLSKSNCPNRKPDDPVFSNLPNLIINSDGEFDKVIEQSRRISPCRITEDDGFKDLLSRS